MDSERQVQIWAYWMPWYSPESWVLDRFSAALLIGDGANLQLEQYTKYSGHPPAMESVIITSEQRVN
jgi:hypothetical protein